MFKILWDIHSLPFLLYIFLYIDRLQPKKPQTHLKAGGDFHQSTESTENFVYPRIKQTQEIDAKQIKDDSEEDKWIEEDEDEKRKKDEEIKILVSKLEDLNGRPLEIPEYRDAYKVYILLCFLFIVIIIIIYWYYLYVLFICIIENYI